MRPRSTTRVVLTALAPLVLTCGLADCSSDPPAEEDCSTRVDLACAPAFAPSFDNVFQKILQPSCGLAGSSCHASAGRKAGVVLDDPAAAHRTLVEGRKVVPGKPECSPMAKRLLSADVAFMMPPGMALVEGEKCAVIQWIAGGATR
jgi:hypothetical protein